MESPSKKTEERSKDMINANPAVRTELPNIIHDRWKLGELIGRGNFGKIYGATDISTGRSVVVKSERVFLCEFFVGNRSLEKRVYDALSDSSPNLEGFARMFFYGVVGSYSVLVLTRLGCTLEYWRKSCGGSFSVKTVLMVGIQGVTRLEHLHNAGYAHGDLHKENLLTGEEDPETIYLVDFGMAKQIRNSWRSDFLQVADILSLVRMLAVISTRDSRILKAVCMLGSAPVDLEEALDTFKLHCDIPELIKIFQVSAKLTSVDTSDYHSLRRILQQGLTNRGLTNDGVFDWVQSSATETNT